MPLHVLIPVVVVSIVVIGGLTWALGLSEQATLDPDTARRRFLDDFPGARIEDVAIADDQRAALIWLGSECGVVFTVGARFATRRLGSIGVEPTDGGVVLRFSEAGAPWIHVAIDDPRWLERLDA